MDFVIWLEIWSHGRVSVGDETDKARLRENATSQYRYRALRSSERGRHLEKMTALQNEKMKDVAQAIAGEADGGCDSSDCRCVPLIAMRQQCN